MPRTHVPQMTCTKDTVEVATSSSALIRDPVCLFGLRRSGHGIQCIVKRIDVVFLIDEGCSEDDPFPLFALTRRSLS